MNNKSPTNGAPTHQVANMGEKSIEAGDGRFIDTVKFVEARAREMQYFQEYMRKKHVGRKIVTQMLPKHMRRRAMSHSRVRIPSRIRKIAKDGFTKSVKRPKKFNLRKTARKNLFRAKTNLLEIFTHNSLHKQSKILETHQFHAKRMKMFDYHNFRVAKRAFGKQFKTAYKFSMLNALVIDKSFYAVLSYQFANSEMSTKALQFLGRFKHYAYLIAKTENGFTVVMDPFLSDDFADYIKLNNLDVVERTDLSESLNVFELIGPNSLKILAKMFTIYSHSDHSNPSQDVQRKLALYSRLFSNATQPIHLPHNFSELVQLHYSDRIVISEPFQSQNVPEDEFEDLSDELNQFVSSYKGGEQASAFLSIAKAHANEFKRHKEIIQARIDAQSNAADHEPPKAQGRFVKQKEQLTIREVFPGQVIPLLVKNVSSYQSRISRGLSKVLVLSPASTGNFLLKNIARNGAKVIGVNEYNFVLQNHGFNVFPRDFVDVASGRKYHEGRQTKNEAKFLRYPDNKKFNYANNDFPLPFGINMDYLVDSEKAEFEACRICTLTKGAVEANALVFECQESDLSHLIKQAKYEGLWDAIMSFSDEGQTAPRQVKRDCDREFAELDDYKQFLQQSAVCDRSPIGQVLGGGFNYLLRRPAGQCFVRADKLKQSIELQTEFFNDKTLAEELRRIDKLRKALVLVRNPRSLDYHLAFVF
jgi:hypothetical protein